MIIGYHVTRVLSIDEILTNGLLMLDYMMVTLIVLCELRWRNCRTCIGKNRFCLASVNICWNPSVCKISISIKRFI